MFKIDLNTHRAPLQELRPTQLTVGLRRVAEKRKELKAVPAKRRRQLMAAQLYPAVRGPGRVFYILDHHHEAVAALQEKADTVSIGLVAELSHLSREASGSTWITGAGFTATTRPVTVERSATFQSVWKT